MMRSLALVALALAACSSGPASSRRIIDPATGYAAYVIDCEQSPDFCTQEARRVCPKGHHTIEPGRTSYYDDQTEPFASRVLNKERKNYKQIDWVISCH
jgi:hypothetical protein